MLEVLEVLSIAVREGRYGPDGSYAGWPLGMSTRDGRQCSGSQQDHDARHALEVTLCPFEFEAS